MSGMLIDIYAFCVYRYKFEIDEAAWLLIRCRNSEHRRENAKTSRVAA